MIRKFIDILKTNYNLKKTNKKHVTQNDNPNHPKKMVPLEFFSCDLQLPTVQSGGPFTGKGKPSAKAWRSKESNWEDVGDWNPDPSKADPIVEKHGQMENMMWKHVTMSLPVFFMTCEQRPLLAEERNIVNSRFQKIQDWLGNEVGEPERNWTIQFNRNKSGRSCGIMWYHVVSCTVHAYWECFTWFGFMLLRDASCCFMCGLVMFHQHQQQQHPSNAWCSKEL